MLNKSSFIFSYKLAVVYISLYTPSSRKGERNIAMLLALGVQAADNPLSEVQQFILLTDDFRFSFFCIPALKFKLLTYISTRKNKWGSPNQIK